MLWLHDLSDARCKLSGSVSSLNFSRALGHHQSVPLGQACILMKDSRAVYKADAAESRVPP